MDVSASPVRRCVAVASHGKRCQQSPFRGSPYCWHHLQSRKVPAPSRPFRVAPAPDVEEVWATLELPVIDRIALAVRLAQCLDEHELSELVRFVEDRRDGTLVLAKRDGRVAGLDHHRRAGVAEARSATG